MAECARSALPHNTLTIALHAVGIKFCFSPATSPSPKVDQGEHSIIMGAVVLTEHTIAVDTYLAFNGECGAPS